MIGFWMRLPSSRHEALWWWLRSWLTWSGLRARWPFRLIREWRLNRMSDLEMSRWPTFVDGVGPPLEQLVEDARDRGDAQTARDFQSAIKEIQRLRLHAANSQPKEPTP